MNVPARAVIDEPAERDFDQLGIVDEMSRLTLSSTGTESSFSFLLFSIPFEGESREGSRWWAKAVNNEKGRVQLKRSESIDILHTRRGE